MTTGGHNLMPCDKCGIWHCSKCGCPRDQTKSQDIKGAA